MRLLVRVRPGSSRPQVGGAYDGPHGRALVVAVRARAVEGAANQAVVVALARAFGVRRRSVSIVRGAASRDKVVDVDGPDVAEVLSRLLGEDR